MKLKLTYSPEEAREADLIVHFALGLLPGAKVRRDKSKAPQLCVYVTVKTAKPVAAVGKHLDKTAPLGYNKTKE